MYAKVWAAGGAKGLIRRGHKLSSISTADFVMPFLRNYVSNVVNAASPLSAKQTIN